MTTSVPARIVSRLENKCVSYFVDKDGCKLTSPISLSSYKSLKYGGSPSADGLTANRGWKWLYSEERLQVNTPSGSLSFGDVLLDQPEFIYVCHRPDAQGVVSLAKSTYRTSVVDGKLTITPNPPDLTIINGVLTVIDVSPKVTELKGA